MKFHDAGIFLRIHPDRFAEHSFILPLARQALAARAFTDVEGTRSNVLTDIPIRLIFNDDLIFDDRKFSRISIHSLSFSQSKIL
ncbi:hypothetical protein EEK90_10390 [Muribaculaceae bacterium Isolate-036 (Harlan)]|nr:hypothetical protein EEK90_10390 [Muribaculaceae bacterium Isolate-036 (Harlan)]